MTEEHLASFETTDMAITTEACAPVAERFARALPTKNLIETLTNEREASARANGDPSAQIIYEAVRSELSLRSADVRDLMNHLMADTPEAVVNHQINSLYQVAHRSGDEWLPTY